MMSWIRVFGRRPAQRLAVVDSYRFADGVRRRFAIKHGALDDAAVALVEDAARQWFRLAVRQPKVQLFMPSIVVDDLWHEMILDTPGYADFCVAVFGRFLHHVPESMMPSAGDAAYRTVRLGQTFRLAQEDERGRPGALPLLFRVDRELKIKGARRYVADCAGGRCRATHGAICLWHVAGVGKVERRRPARWRGGPTPGEINAVHDGGSFDGGCSSL